MEFLQEEISILYKEKRWLQELQTIHPSREEDVWNDGKSKAFGSWLIGV